MKTLTLFKNENAKRIFANIFYPILSIAIVIAVWAIVAAVKDNPLVLPMPDVVFAEFFTLGADKTFWLAVLSSILRTIICFVTSFAIALLFAACGALWTPIHKVLSPMVTILRAAPTVAVILIMYAFFESDTMAIVVGFLISFPIMYSAFYGAITGIDADLIEMAKLYKVKPFDRILKIYLPSIAECLFDTSKSTLSLTLKVVVAAEILTSISTSIGGKIQVAYASFDIGFLLAWTLVAIVFSFVLEGVVSILKKVWEKTR